MITVLRAGALGDVLLTLPALHALRAHYPQHPLRVIGNPATWSVVGPLVAEARSIDAPEIATLYACSAHLPPWLTDTDLFVAWSVHPLPGLGGAGHPVIQASPYPPPGVHASQWLLDTLIEARVVPDTIELPLPAVDLLRLSMAERDAGTHALDVLGVCRPLLIHPGAGALWKRWPAERFAAVAQWAREQGRQVALVQGPADASAVAAVQECLGTSLPVIRETSLRRLAAIMAASSHFVGNDSGVTHLAAMAGVPTVAIFGPTDPVSWAPLGEVTVLRSCAYRAGKQGQLRVCDDPRCLEAVDGDRVIAALQ